VSADLTQLARTQVVVVCAGAKAILDLPATLEMLETLCVPVVGYQTDEFPAFYSRSSGLKTGCRAESPAEVAEIARAHWNFLMPSSVLITVPPPEDVALAPEAVQGAIQQALDEAKAQQIRGQGVTPFLLRRVSELTEGESLRVNLALLCNNAHLAAQIARHISSGGVGEPA
jgi:pseudouridylate synthase